MEIIKTNQGFFLYSQYGRVGGTAAKEYRPCQDQLQAESEGQKLIKSKLKKGYVEVKLAKADIGSSVGQTKIDTSVSVDTLKRLGTTVSSSSSLHPEVQNLVRTWFGVTQEFVNLNLDTKKCPLGQLSADQLDLARQILDQAQLIISTPKPDVLELNKLTNQYYSNIPHNFGYRRLDADALRLDSNDKVVKAFDMLDVFADAKNVQAVMSKESAIDAQYATLKADLNYVDPSSPIFKWVDAMLLGTRASNHSSLGKLKTRKVFQVHRHGEDKFWRETAEKIAKDKCKFNPSPVNAEFVKMRPDVPTELVSLYQQANILPAWHGTRRANMIGITTKGFLIRPSGVPLAGSMYGNAVYFGFHSSKSINYCDVKGSHWAQGNNNTAYLFLVDAICGNSKIATGAYSYTPQNIKPYHSVWAKGGNSGVINDELMLYYPSGPNQQHNIRYIVEFEVQAR